MGVQENHGIASKLLMDGHKCKLESLEDSSCIFYFWKAIIIFQRDYLTLCSKPHTGDLMITCKVA